MPSTPKNKPVTASEEQQDVVSPAETASLADLENKLAELKQQAAELQAKADAVKPAPPVESTPLPEDRLASQATDEEVARAEVLRDPYDTSNALKILCDPPGKKLRWISLTYREMRNMGGWTAVRFDDAIGRELSKYVGEPPARMAGTANLDAVVRRGDVFLAWIDIGIWNKRQMRREAEANRRIASHVTTEQKPLGKHARTTDAGLANDPNPYQEVRVAPHFVRGTRGYREQAKGTIEDPSIKTGGRNLFEEAPAEE